MAAQTRLVRFSWENNVNFKMDTKIDDGDWITISYTEENGEIAKLWPSISQSCIVFMKEKLDGIGDDMKAE